ncbi:MAG: MlaD family protein, partial [Thermoleophilaceae bacterium]
MRSKSATASLVSSPVLVGAVTVMVTLVAVFLAYNANEGLPFVPTYDIKALVPNAGGVTKDNEVRIGGSRVGVVKKITAQPTPSGAVGVLHMTLDKRLSLRDDTALTIRPRSPLGLRYIQVVPGTKGKLVPQNGTLPLRDAQPNVDLDQVQNTLDAPTRQALQDALGDLGPGLAGRGIDFNAFVAQSPGLFKGLEDVARNLADPATGLDGFVKGAARAVDEVAPVSSQLADTVTSANVTAGALAGVKAQLRDVIAQSPGTESTATSALAAARPVLRDTHGFLHDLAPGARALPAAAARLHSALARG